MMTGKLKFLRLDKGYGFIEPSDGTPDVFAHISDIDASQREFIQADLRDIPCEFDAALETKGPRAKNIRLLIAPSE